MQQLLKHCLVHHVTMPKKEALDQFYKVPIAESLYQLGDIRKVSQGLLCNSTKEAYEQNKQDDMDKNVHIAIRAAWITLFEAWGPSDELDLETKDANLAGLLFHQNLPLYLEKGADYKLYEQILEYIRWSDRADFWAFFHQCWPLLAISLEFKCKLLNLHLSQIPKPICKKQPTIEQLEYTWVLTKQSSLFNAWKEICIQYDTNHIPIHYVCDLMQSSSPKLQFTEVPVPSGAHGF